MTFDTADLWADDAIQFPRLLAELLAIGGFTDAQYAELAAAMDLSRPEIDELLDRADRAWDAAKERQRRSQS